MNRHKQLIAYVLVIILMLIGGGLRFYQIAENPPGLNIDEVAFGYNAYSILKTGRDEYGKWLPLSFRSVGDYKNPVPVYLMSLSVRFFGLNEFAVRFPNAFIGTLSIFVFFALFFKLTKSFTLATIGAALTAFSPWHIYYSRYAYEGLIATTCLSLGIFCLFNVLVGRKLFILPAAIFLALAPYTYYSTRLITPLLVGAFLFINHKQINKNNFWPLLISLSTTILLVSPLIWSIFFGPDATRANMVFLGNDVEYTRLINLNHLIPLRQSILDLPNFAPVLDGISLSLFWFKRYINYLQPDFLFLSGLNMTSSGSFGLGLMYFFEIPFFIFGLISLIRKRIANSALIVSWLLIGLLPASLANNEQHAGRSLVILPMLVLVSSFGLFKFLHFLLEVKRFWIKSIFTLAVSGVILLSWIHALVVFSVHFPVEKSEAFMYGSKEAALYIKENADKYREVVFDPVRGADGPYIVSVPYLYTLFYLQVDPAKYQAAQKIDSQDTFGFDKYVFRPIDWRSDRYKKGVLFIGSPWRIPLQDLDGVNVLKKIYLKDGRLAYLIVTPL